MSYNGVTLSLTSSSTFVRIVRTLAAAAAAVLLSCYRSCEEPRTVASARLFVVLLVRLQAAPSALLQQPPSPAP